MLMQKEPKTQAKIWVLGQGPAARDAGRHQYAEVGSDDRYAKLWLIKVKILRYVKGSFG